MTLLSEFVDDPVTFATNRALTIPGPGVTMHFKQKQFQHDQQNVPGLQVAGGERVYWFDVDVVKHDRTMAEVRLQANYDEALPAAYWLPWEEDQIIRTALRPSKKATGSLEGVDPDYFFTAPLTGCTVFVEGPRDQPTVYHANARSHGGSFDTQLARQQFLELQREKVEEMQRRYSAFSTQQEKQPRNGGSPGNSGREASMLDYLSRAHSPAFSEELEEVVSKWTGGKASKIEVVGKKVVITSAEGTVFGVRRHGEWTFYFQKRVRVEYWVNDYQHNVSNQGWLRWGFSWLNPVDYWKWVYSSWKKQAETWLPMTCKEFWPGGDGRVVMRH